MSAVTARQKALRLLAEGRLAVTRVQPRQVQAYVDGDSGQWECGYLWGSWWCSCPARGRCSHLMALRLVVPAPLELVVSS